MSVQILPYKVNNAYLPCSSCACSYQAKEINEELKFCGVAAGLVGSRVCLMLEEDNAPKQFCE